MKTVLSVDLDWFNSEEEEKTKSNSQYQQITTNVKKFFHQLQENCNLPTDVTIMEEHHFLYPWAKEFMINNNVQEIELINIDEHHDFYYADSINDFDRDLVDCSNFFNFMVFDDMLSKYHWICSASEDSSVLAQISDIMKHTSDSWCRRIRKFQEKISVVGRQSAIEVIKGRNIDGFVIVKSPDYTNNKEIIYSAVDKIFNHHDWNVKYNKQTTSFTRLFINQNIEERHKYAVCSM